MSRSILRTKRPTAVFTQSAVTDKGERFLAFFDVTLNNKSKRRVLARKRKPGQPALLDGDECLQHSCSLLLRRVDAGAPLATQIRWFNDPKAKSPLPTDIVANLLVEYEYDVEGKEDFWLEPFEVSHLGVGVILEPGVYLAMVTFVGQPSGDKEFWRRQFIVQIPERDAVLKKGGAEGTV